jgi:uncharacterized membrane protein YkvA (DUF1232 family)
MSRNQLPAPVSQEPSGTFAGWIGDMVRQARLAWRLFWDKRVPFWTKLIPPAVLLYILSPADFIPDFPILGLGQLDDLAVLLIGMKLFIELAPTEIVREHLAALGARIKEWRVVEEEKEPPLIVEGEYEMAKTGDVEEIGAVEVVEVEEVEPEELEAEEI